MKKLMMALAVVACAAAAQASVVKWSSTAVAFNGTKLGGQTVQLYLVGVGGAADILFDTRTTLSAPPANKGKLTSNTGSGQSSYVYNSTGVAGGGFTNNDTGADLGRQYYMVITYNDGTKDYKYTSSAVASSGLSSTSLGTVDFTFNDTISTKAGAKDAWVAVPEPTSGLLMLLGFAGLALRRRRA